MAFDPALLAWAMADWTRPLSRALTLKSGERLTTLRDAGELCAVRFGNPRQNAPVEQAINLLLQAAETGKRADREAATDQVAFVLRLNALA